MADKKYLDEAGLSALCDLLPSITSASGSYSGGFSTTEIERFARVIGDQNMDPKSMFFAKMFFTSTPIETYLLPATIVSCMNFTGGDYFNTVVFDTSAIPGTGKLFSVSVSVSGEESGRTVTVDTNLDNISFTIVKIIP